MGQRLLEVIRPTGAGPTRTLQNSPARSLRCATNGIDNIDKSKRNMADAARTLRGAATLLAVLALAALLTTVRHNASAYLTGVWDTGSQTLVYGRIHQMEQGAVRPRRLSGCLHRRLERRHEPRTVPGRHPHRRGGVPPLHPPVGLAGLAVPAGSTVCCGTGCPTVWRGRLPSTG